MKKIKRILILTIVTIIGVASFGCKPSNESVYPVYGDFECKVVTEHNGEELDNPYVIVMGLSEEGKSKKTIVIPSKIGKYEVKIGGSGFYGYRGYWESDNLEKVYICNDVYIVASSFLWRNMLQLCKDKSEFMW